MESDNYSSFQYGKIVQELLEEKDITHYRVNGEGELTCTCPFHNDTRPSFSISLKKGLYCCHACSEKGNIVQFVSKMKEMNISNSIKLLEEQGYEIENRHSEKGYYILEDYAKEKNLDVEFLSDKLHMHTAELDKKIAGKAISIPYFNEQNYQIGVRYRYSPTSKVRFSWRTGSKQGLYGLQLLDKFSSYVILVEGESDCHCAWVHDIYALGVPGAKNFKKEYSQYLDKFDKIYIHQEPDKGGIEFVKKICQSLSSDKLDKLYTISAFELDDECKDLADLHKKGKLDKDTILSKAQKIPKLYLNEITKLDDDAEHVVIANKVLEQLNIKYYKGNFYVYENGVYKEGLTKIEKCITDINRNLKKSAKSEVLDFLRITQCVDEEGLDKNIINYMNGLYHIDTGTLEPHTPEYFTLCQLNANYLTDEELETLKQRNDNVPIDDFFETICCGHKDRIDTLQESLGYSSTYNVDFAVSIFLVGPTARNGKSTFLKLSSKMFGKSNSCSIAIEEFSERFSCSDLTNKLVNLVHEIGNIQIKDVSKFKSVVAGDEISVEIKYLNKFKIEPFAHHFFAMNNLPDLKTADEGYFERIHIVPFEAQFTDEQKEAFDFNKITTQVSLDYLANISLRKYLKMKKENRRHFSNYTESYDYIESYKNDDNTVLIFLNNVSEYSYLLDKDKRVKVKELYEAYLNWCKNENEKISSRSEFNICALASGIFKRGKLKDGYPCFIYTGNANLSNISSKPKSQRIKKEPTYSWISNYPNTFGKNIHF